MTMTTSTDAGVRDIALLHQLVMGLYLGFATYSGITYESWGNFFGVLVVGGIFMGPLFLSLSRDPGIPRAGRIAAASMGLIALLIFAALLISVFERIYMVNTKHYPKWLASGTFTFKGGIENAVAPDVCKDRGPIEWVEKDGGSWIVTCGGLYRPMAERFVATPEKP